MSGNAIEVNGQWYSPVTNNNAPSRGRGRGRGPTARSRNWAQSRANAARSRPQTLVIGTMPTNLPTWKSFPGEQWHVVSGFSFPDRWNNGNIAYASMKTELGKIKTLHETTKVYSVMYGFICKSDGYAGFMTGFDTNNPTGPVAPDRVKVKKNAYCAKQQVFPAGTTVSELKNNWSFIWEFDAAPVVGTEKQVTVTQFWVSTTPLPGVKPPSNFLVCED